MIFHLFLGPAYLKHNMIFHIFLGQAYTSQINNSLNGQPIWIVW